MIDPYSTEESRIPLESEAIAERVLRQNEIDRAAEAASEQRRIAEEEARAQAARVRAIAEAQRAHFQHFTDPITGRSELTPEGQPPASTEVARRVLSTQGTPTPTSESPLSARGEAIRADVESGGAAVNEIAKSAMEDAASTRPGIRFSVGGQWYEQNPHGYTKVDTRQGSRGTVFTPHGGEATPDDMEDIRQKMRAGGAFGQALPEHHGPGGFSPSPKIEDVAVMPDSVLEDVLDKTKLAAGKRALEGLGAVPDSDLPEGLRGLGLTREELKSLQLSTIMGAGKGFKGGGPAVESRLNEADREEQQALENVEKSPAPEDQKERLREIIKRRRINKRLSTIGPEKSNPLEQ